MIDMRSVPRCVVAELLEMLSLRETLLVLGTQRQRALERLELYDVAMGSEVLDGRCDPRGWERLCMRRLAVTDAVADVVARVEVRAQLLGEGAATPRDIRRQVLELLERVAELDVGEPWLLQHAMRVA